jgi:hypothetical protein
MALREFWAVENEFEQVGFYLTQEDAAYAATERNRRYPSAKFRARYRVLSTAASTTPPADEAPWDVAVPRTDMRIAWMGDCWSLLGNPERREGSIPEELLTVTVDTALALITALQEWLLNNTPTHLTTE